MFVGHASACTNSNICRIARNRSLLSDLWKLKLLVTKVINSKLEEYSGFEDHQSGSLFPPKALNHSYISHFLTFYYNKKKKKDKPISVSSQRWGPWDHVKSFFSKACMCCFSAHQLNQTFILLGEKTKDTLYHKYVKVRSSLDICVSCGKIYNNIYNEKVYRHKII